MDLLKGMLGGSSAGASSAAGGAKSDRAKRQAGVEGQPRRRRAKEYDRISSISIPRYRMSPSHVEYTIEVRKAGIAWHVHRRYQQFKKLHADLTALCPMTTPYHCEYGVVPVLCGSSWTEVTNQSTELVERRRRFLEIYLEQLLVSRNKFYQQRTALYSFLHDDEVVLTSKPGTTPLPGLGAGGGALAYTPVDESFNETAQAAAAAESAGHPQSGVVPIAAAAAAGQRTERTASVPAPSYLNIIGDHQGDHAVTSPTLSPETRFPVTGEAPTPEQLIAADLLERCTDCGRMEVVDYVVDSWEDFGPCDTCLRYTKWQLVRQQGETEPTVIRRSDAFRLQMQCIGLPEALPPAAPGGTAGPPAAPPPSGEDGPPPLAPASPAVGEGGASPAVPGTQPCSPADASGSPRRQPHRPAPAAGDSEQLSLGEALQRHQQMLQQQQQQQQERGRTGVTQSPSAPPQKGTPELPPFGVGSEGEHSRSATHVTSASEVRPDWKRDVEVRHCELCQEAFSFFLRKHHCRRCGGIFCGHCAKFTVALPEMGYTKEVRVCKSCKMGQTSPSPAGSETVNVVTAAGKTPPTSARDRQRQARVPRSRSRSGSRSSAGRGEERDCIPLGGQGGSGAEEEDEERERRSPPPPEAPRSVVEHGALAGLQLQRELQPSDFELITTLGKGTFGKVMKVAYRDTGDVYAMKVLSKKVVHKRRMAEYIREEKRILSRVRHPFIVGLHASFQTEHHLYLILEFLPGGELYGQIYSLGRFGEADARFYAAELALALQYLHSIDIVHRDIKPENIVLDREGHARLTDFGLARAEFSAAPRCSFLGSPEYIAPEVVRGEPQTSAVDWWAFGVLLYELLAGMAPFNGPNSNDVYQQILHKELDFAAAHIRSADAVSLLQGLLCRDISKRLCVPEKVMAHPFWGTIDWTALLEKRVTPPFVPDLAHNDTRYFSREFTHEWARIDCEHTADGKATLDLLSNKFDTFPVAGTAVSGAAASGLGHPEQRSVPRSLPQMPWATSPRAYAGRVDGLNNIAGTIVDELACTPQANAFAASAGRSMEEVIMHEHQQLIRDLCGEWRLLSLEVLATDGRVSYPWGPAAVGQLLFTTHGLFSMQLASPKDLRPRFRDPDYKKVTRDEMAEAYIGYVAFFGTFTHTPGRTYINQHIQASLCPNWTGTTQKRYFGFIDAHNQPDPERDNLILATGPIGVEGETARTIMRFERCKQGRSGQASNPTPKMDPQRLRPVAESPPQTIST